MSSLGSVRSGEDGPRGEVAFVSCVSCFNSTAFGERHCQSCENIDSMPANIMIPVTAQKEITRRERKREKVGCLNVSPPQFLYLQLSHWHQSILGGGPCCTIIFSCFHCPPPPPLSVPSRNVGAYHVVVLRGTLGGKVVYWGEDVCVVVCVLLTSNRCTHARYLAPIQQISDRQEANRGVRLDAPSVQ